MKHNKLFICLKIKHTESHETKCAQVFGLRACQRFFTLETEHTEHFLRGFLTVLKVYKSLSYQGTLILCLWFNLIFYTAAKINLLATTKLSGNVHSLILIKIS